MQDVTEDHKRKVEIFISRASVIGIVYLDRGFIYQVLKCDFLNIVDYANVYCH